MINSARAALKTFWQRHVRKPCAADCSTNRLPCWPCRWAGWWRGSGCGRSQDVCAGVLINSSFASLSPFYQRLRWQSYRQFVRLLAAKTAYDRELGIVRLVSNRCDQERTAVARLGKHSPAAADQPGKQFPQLCAARYRPGSGNANKPVLLLNSLGDRLVSPACSGRHSTQVAPGIAQSPECWTRFAPGCGRLGDRTIKNLGGALLIADRNYRGSAF